MSRSVCCVAGGKLLGGKLTGGKLTGLADLLSAELDLQLK